MGISCCSKTIGYCFPIVFWKFLLEISCCSRTMGYCFPIVFWNFCGRQQGLNGLGQSRDRGFPSPPQQGKPWYDTLSFQTAMQKNAVIPCSITEQMTTSNVLTVLEPSHI